MSVPSRVPQTPTAITVAGSDRHIDTPGSSLAPLVQVARDGPQQRIELLLKTAISTQLESLDVVVVETVIVDGHDPPAFGSFEIQNDICAPSVAARVGRAVDHLLRISGDASLAAGEAQRHHHGIETGSDPPERRVSLLTIGRRHLVMMVDLGKSHHPISVCVIIVAKTSMVCECGPSRAPHFLKQPRPIAPDLWQRPERSRP